MKSGSLLSLSVSALVVFASVKAAPFNATDASHGERPYEGYRVLSVRATNAAQVDVLSELTERLDVDFWSFQPTVSEESTLSVAPDAVEEVEGILTSAGLEVKTIIKNLQVSVDRERWEQAALGTRAHLGKSDKSPVFDRYLRYDEIREYAEDLQKKYPGRVTVESFGKTVEKRDLWVIKLTSDLAPRNFERKRAVFLDAGIHAREWIAPAAALYLLNQLAENSTVSGELLAGLDWYIVPVLNPDGYEFSHTDKRLWRKNRSDNHGARCMGVDLNRNFEYHWNEEGASSNPCAETFSGPGAASEPETQSLQTFLQNHKPQIVMYLTLHSYGNYLLYPWGFTTDLPEDWKELDDLARKANKAMVAAGSKPYRIGSSTNVLYAAAGGSDDYAKGLASIQKSYTMELPGGGSSGFDMPPSKIKKTVTQVFEGLRVFGNAAKTLNV